MAHRKSMKQVIFSFIFILILGLSLLLFIPVFLRTLSLIKSELLYRGKSLAQNFVYNSQSALQNRQRIMINTLTDSLMKEPDVLWVAVFDPDGNVLAQNGRLADLGDGLGKIKNLASSREARVHELRVKGQKVYNMVIRIPRLAAAESAQASEMTLLGMGDIETGAASANSSANEDAGILHFGLSSERLRAVNVSLLSFFGIVLILALTIGGVAASAFTQFLLTPIGKLNNLLRDIASNRGDLTQRIQLAREDELGEMAKYFDGFIGNIASIIRQTLSLTHSLTLSVTEISSTAEELGATSEQINTTIQNVVQDLEDQDQQLIQNNTSIETSLKALLQITDEAKSAHQLSQETHHVSADGSKKIKKLLGLIHQIAEQMQLIVDRMKNLDQSLQGIGDFVISIQEIASQTNLLALNAAIEAARAGESGRGFSVVAGEVRKLAENSTSASGQIEELIQRIKLETAATTEATQKGAEVVANGSEILNQADSTLDEIIHSALKSSSVIEKIAQSLMLQSSTLNDMIGRSQKVQLIVKNNTEAVHTVAASVEEQSAAIEQINSSIQDLSEKAESVSSTVVQFKV